jgi:hypothetical protein
MTLDIESTSYVLKGRDRIIQWASWSPVGPGEDLELELVTANPKRKDS